MQIHFDTYSYAATASQASPKAANRSNNTKKNVDTDTNTNTYTKVKEQAADAVQSQKETADTSEIKKNDETTFSSSNIFEKYEKYFKVLKEHYTKVNEENKKFADPQKHIKDKYYNKNSSYYVSGLTQKEREICAKAEQDMLDGIPPALNSFDPVIQKNFKGCNIFMMDMEWNQEVRDNMNDAVNQAFQESGIIIPQDADLQLTVDPYEFYIHAHGVDEELARRIEEVLNKGENGYNLYYHISNSNPVNYGVEEPSQYSAGDPGKAAIYHLVDRLTGYDIRELEHRDGKFYTPEGEDLWKVLTDKYNEMAADGSLNPFGLGEYYADYKRIAKEGWDRSTDSNLTIAYKNNSLCDIDTSYGYGKGQTAWQGNVEKWYEEEYKLYQREREDTLRKERSTKTNLETEIEKTQQNNGKEGFVELTPPDISKLQEILNRMQKDGLLVPLTDRVLSLQGKGKMILNFDHKA